MNRRSFLASFAAAAVLDPERLLWVPGKKTICWLGYHRFEFDAHELQATCVYCGRKSRFAK